MFPELQTEHFGLKEITPADQSFIFKGLSHPDVIPFYGMRYDSYEATSAQMEFYRHIWEEKTGCWWKIVDKGSGLPVGACGINGYNAEHEKAEIGYWLLPEYWKKGIMQEVIPTVITHLFKNWRLHRLEAVIEQGNEASCRLSEKFGFRYEGTMRESEMKYGNRISLLVYSLLSTDPR